LQQEGIDTVSCSRIGAELNLQPIQVRKDLQMTGIIGKPKIGYPVAELTAAIEKCLGWHNVNKAVLVGAGSLGTALLGYPRFGNFGLHIVAGFDSDAKKVGRSVHQYHILPLTRLPALVRRRSIHIGIITVPATAAQQVADLLVNSGIIAIWNFAPVTLRVPGNIIVHNEDLYYSLAALSCKLAQVLDNSTR